MMLSEYLRTRAALPGTKVVCAEGDCGACSALVAWQNRTTNKLHASPFRLINTCIFPVYQLHGASLVTIEGIAETNGTLNQVQRKLGEHHASQCGYCTPGFVMALTYMGVQTEKRDSQTVKNYCTGNLCRCTGYQPIIDAGVALDAKMAEPLAKRYFSNEIQRSLQKWSATEVSINTESHVFFQPASATKVSASLKKPRMQIVGSATDLGVLHNKEKIRLTRVLSLQGLKSAHELSKSGSAISIGARVDLESLRIFSKKSHAEFSNFLNIFASPPIRNSATLVGNIANASPIADTVPYLMIQEAVLNIQGSKTKRKVPITRFYKGYKKTDLKTGEWIESVHVPNPSKNEFTRLYKISQRRDLDISTVNGAFSVEKTKSGFANFKMALGGVAATTLRMTELEKHFQKHPLSLESLPAALVLLEKSLKPLSDHRATGEYRLLMVQNFLTKFFREAGIT